MASPQKLSSGNYYILSRFGGNQYKRSLKTQDARKARFFKTRPEESNHLINGGRLELPVNVDIPTFRLADGKLASRPLIRPLFRFQVLCSRGTGNVRRNFPSELLLEKLRVPRAD